MTVQDALGEIPLVGGSSGDGMRFKETGIFSDGDFHPPLPWSRSSPHAARSMSSAASTTSRASSRWW
jgi:hypothetical protein